METADEKHLRIVRDYEQSKRKNEMLGLYANVLVEEHLKDPDKYPADFILKQLVNERERIGFEKIID